MARVFNARRSTALACTERARPAARTSRDRVAAAAERYAVLNMARQIEASRSRPPVLKRAVAALVLVAVAALVIHSSIGLVVAVFWIVGRGRGDRRGALGRQRLF